MLGDVVAEIAHTVQGGDESGDEDDGEGSGEGDEGVTLKDRQDVSVSIVES